MTHYWLQNSIFGVTISRMERRTRPGRAGLREWSVLLMQRRVLVKPFAFDPDMGRFLSTGPLLSHCVIGA